MTLIGLALSLVCAALGGLQLWAATHRQAHELAAVPLGRHGLLEYEFAATPTRLRVLMVEAGERGQAALRRGLELDRLVVAGYVFVAIGLAGVLTAVSRGDLGRWMILFALLAAGFALLEELALRVATTADEATTAPLATAAAALKYLALGGAVAAFCLWPVRTWFG